MMLVGARLNWLLGHGAAPQWNANASFIQVDIEPTELDSNQPIAAPLVGDIESVMTALIERTEPDRSHSRRPGATSRRTLGAERRQDGAAPERRSASDAVLRGASSDP